VLLASYVATMAVSGFPDRCGALRAGEHVVILGPSGCGKSTLLRLLAGLEAPSADQVLLDGDIVSVPGQILRPPYLRGVALVFQDLALWPNLSVMDNVLLGLSGAGITKQEARARARKVLALCKIVALADRKPGFISEDFLRSLAGQGVAS
jgi:ABC-type sugar transport system ATPase subunit